MLTDTPRLWFWVPAWNIQSHTSFVFSYIWRGGEHSWRCLGTHSWWYLNPVVHCLQAEQWWEKKWNNSDSHWTTIENIMSVNRYMQFWVIFLWDSGPYCYKFAPSSLSLYLGSLMLPFFPENLLRRTNLLVTCIASLLSSFSWTQRTSWIETQWECGARTLGDGTGMSGSSHLRVWFCLPRLWKDSGPFPEGSPRTRALPVPTVVSRTRGAALRATLGSWGRVKVHWEESQPQVTCRLNVALSPTSAQFGLVI